MVNTFMIVSEKIQAGIQVPLYNSHTYYLIHVTFTNHVCFCILVPPRLINNDV